MFWGILLAGTAFIGFILMVLGAIAFGMFIFGIRKVEVDTRNELRIKIGMTEMGIRTCNMFFAIALGAIMVAGGFYARSHRGEKGKLNQAQAAIPQTRKLEEGGYTISEEEVRIDLRNRKELGKIEHYASQVSKTERLVTIVIKDVGSGVKEVNFRHATSGPGIGPIEKLAGAKWRRIEYESKEVVYNPFTALLKGKEFFKNLLARKGKMRSYYMTVPITVGKGQEILYKLKYHNAFQGRDFEWAGKLFSADTDILTMHITFPEDKPFKSFETYKKAPGAKEKVRINDPNIETALDNHVLRWTIQSAKKGEKYYIRWLW